MRTPNESHTEVSSRNEGDNPGRLDRPSSETGHGVNETSSRKSGARMTGLCPRSTRFGADTASMRPRRTALDPLRMDYHRRVTTPSGQEVVVRARRKIDADSVDPVGVPLPVVVVAIWTALHEYRNHSRYHHQWIVEEFPRFEPHRAQVVAQGRKRDALDLVDRHARDLATGSNETP